MKDITLNVNVDTIKKIIAANEATGKKAEWIGILFYKKINNTTLETVDICYMGKGPENSMVASIDYTEYPELSSVLSNYVINNAERLIGCYQGLIHSHIDISTSPSGTDLSELVVNNPNYNGTYLSVICNHRLEFTSLISIEEEQPERVTNYKWFGQAIVRKTKPEKTINVYSIETNLSNEEYPDITEALEIVKKSNKFKMSSQKSLWDTNSWSNWESNQNTYLDDLNEYFEFSSKVYADKVQILNNYTKHGFNVDDFVKAITPFKASQALKDLHRFSHTKFVKDFKDYIDIFKLGYDEL